MRIIITNIILLLTYFLALTVAQDNSKVTMPLEEFQDIFSSARLKDAERDLLDRRKIQEVEYQQKLKELDNICNKVDAETSRDRSAIFPDNFQVVHQTAKGLFNATSSSAGVEGDVASFEIAITVRMMESRWTSIPIANTSATVASDWQIAWRSDGSDQQDFHLIDYVTLPDVMLLRRQGQQVLATNRSGLFQIKFRSYARVSKTRSLHALGLSSLLYPLADFSLRIASDSNTGLVQDLSVQPSAAVLRVTSEKGFIDINANLPLDAEFVQIRWLSAATDANLGGDPTPLSYEASMDNKVDLVQTTASHEVLHFVGEGILRSTHMLDLKTSSDTSTLNSLQFSIHGEGVRVTSIAGHALQTWTVETDESTSSMVIVRVTFKSSYLDSDVQLQVHTEMDRASSSGVRLPRIMCSNVLRQTGSIAIIKDANVEVYESETSGLSRCDASEVSSRLRLNTGLPIVLSYKYLNPEHSVILHVKEHAPLDTLDATIDRLHYQAVVTDTHTIHSMIMIVQSTKLQYLELGHLPTTASRFSVLVNSVPTKPVEGRDGDRNSILVPLLVGLDPEKANTGGSLKTSVEITFLSSHISLGKNGTIDLSPPNLALPISVLSVHLSLPQSNKYNFTGSFGEEAIDTMSYPIPSAFSYITGKQVVEKGYKFTAKDDVWTHHQTPGAEGSRAVKIITPRTGRSFYFERLLVIDEVLSLNASYKIEQPSVENKSRQWWRLK